MKLVNPDEIQEIKNQNQPSTILGYIYCTLNLRQ